MRRIMVTIVALVLFFQQVYSANVKGIHVSERCNMKGEFK